MTDHHELQEDPEIVALQEEYQALLRPNGHANDHWPDEYSDADFLLPQKRWGA